jgi:transcriptional regulator with XRE-family HTH domain
MSRHFLDVAGRIRAARAAAGLSREALAEPLGLSVNTIARIECGERPLKGRELERLAELCDIPSWFLRDGWAGSEAPEASLDTHRLERAERAMLGGGDRRLYAARPAQDRLAASDAA